MNINSTSVLNNFLNKINIKLDLSKYLPSLNTEPNILYELPNNIIENIIFDAFETSKPILKKIVFQLEKRFEILIGRLLKQLLKKFIDYQFEEDLDRFIYYFKKFSNGSSFTEKEIKELITNNFDSELHNDAKTSSINKYKENLLKAVRDNNETRIYDYLNFIYSRLLNFNELKFITMDYLFQENLEYIRKELTPLEQNDLKSYCDKNNGLDKRERVVKRFNKKYIQILEKRNNYKTKYSVAILKIDENLFFRFPDKEKFYSYMLSLIKYLYSRIRNHRVLAVKIENIIHKNINIKWEIFAYLSIFAEKFIKQPEKRAYYKPEEHFRDAISLFYNLDVDDNDLEEIKSFYQNKLKISEFSNLSIFGIENIKELLDDFRNIYTGFTFEECFILRNNKKNNNTKELYFTENLNEILAIFSKHKFNDAKIPCPICGSLKISGNSYPKVGIRSWECKNPFCGERSKTNRGKRYSERTIFMQDSIYDLTPENTISKNIVKKWRKDIVETKNDLDIYRMLIKYYSYKDDSVLFISLNDVNQLLKKLIEFSDIENRDLKILSVSQFDELIDFNINSFEQFFNSSQFNYLNHFIPNSFEMETLNISNIKNFYIKGNFINLFHGDCFKIMQNFKENSIDCMVTSPPYYNAREYSQWPTLYSYLNEMHKIALISNYVLKPGGVFLFNIGDVYGNPNTTVKSKMGEKRILLGSYITFIYLKAGFELLENYIWNKGEPQSQRHKNDGIFTPYYQKPTNCYEHIFLFKKTGAPLKLNSKLGNIPWKTNIPKFSPVIKIGTNGENRYGHTAPFPPDIPEFACKSFTNENDILLDPFSGSLTSAIIASRNDRIGVGIEILEEYINLSIKRAQEQNINVKLFKDTIIGFKETLINRNTSKNEDMNESKESKLKVQKSLDLYY